MQKKEENFEQKRLELEAWLQRMEIKFSDMLPVGHTADVLEVQLREQKGLHADLHQFKSQIELFQQMTQRLITAHQHEDTSRYKKVNKANLQHSQGSLFNKCLNCLLFKNWNKISIQTSNSKCF